VWFPPKGVTGDWFYVMVTLLRNPNNKNSSPSSVQLFLRPRALRPPAAADYLGTTPGNIEAMMRSGVLRYKLVAGVRVVMVEELDRYIESLPDETGPRLEPVAATAARRAA
jgi:hypothetical protein